jgi:hypothetical protein
MCWSAIIKNSTHTYASQMKDRTTDNTQVVIQLWFPPGLNEEILSGNVTNSRNTRHFCYFHKPYTAICGEGRGLQHTIFRLYYGASLLRERMSHITQGDPSHQYNILSRGVQGVQNRCINGEKVGGRGRSLCEHTASAS